MKQRLTVSPRMAAIKNIQVLDQATMFMGVDETIDIVFVYGFMIYTEKAHYNNWEVQWRKNERTWSSVQYLLFFF
jgi:hypothetical protein